MTRLKIRQLLLATAAMVGVSTVAFAMAEQTTSIELDPQTGCWNHSGEDYAFDGKFKGKTYALVRWQEKWPGDQNGRYVEAKMMRDAERNPRVLQPVAVLKGQWFVYSIARTDTYRVILPYYDRTPDSISVDVCVQSG